MARRRVLILGLVLAPAVGAAIACARDVAVGEYPLAQSEAGALDGQSLEATSPADAGDLDATTDGGADGDAGDDLGGSSIQGVAAVSGTDFFMGGYQGGEAASDLWFGRVFNNGVGGITTTSVTDLDTAGGADRVASVLVTGPAESVLGGFVTTLGGRRAFVRRLANGEATLWTKVLDPATDGGLGTSEATSMAMGATGGTVVAVGNDTEPGGAVDGWLARLAPAGPVVWRTSLRASAPSQASREDTALFAVAVNGLDQVFGGGRRRVVLADGGTAFMPVIVKLDPAGVLSNSAVAFAPAEGTVRQILADPNVLQQTFVCYEAGGAAFVTHLDVSFNVLATRGFTDPRGNLDVGGCALTTDASLVLVGTVSTQAGPVPWSAKLELPSLAVRWVRDIAGGPAHVNAVAPNGAGGAMVVGNRPAPVRRWAASIAP